jgi:hypothetical protein
MKMVRKLLTKRQATFCEEYIANGQNIAAAAKIAGYKPSVYDKKPNNIFTTTVKNYLVERGVRYKTKREQLYADVFPIEKIEQQYETSFDFKLKTLLEIVKKNEDDRVKIAAIAEANKMEGDYSPEKRVTVTIDAEVQEAKRLVTKLIEKYKSDY